MKRDRVQIEAEWYSMASTIRKQEKRELFILSCIGYALGEHIKILGFFDDELQSLWKRTYIRVITKEKPGYIGIKTNGGDSNGR